MFGINSVGVVLAYGLAVISTLLCVIYGIINWNKGSDEVEPGDIKWANEEKEIEEVL
ncbi:MAG: symporter small accessory protein [Sedimentisphaeraceae bacterium JB056]